MLKHKGLNNAFVTGTLLGDVSSLGILPSIASMYPFFMFSSSYKVCRGVTTLSATSSISDVNFYQHASNTEDNYIYRFLASSTHYEFDTVDIS